MGTCVCKYGGDPGNCSPAPCRDKCSRYSHCVGQMCKCLYGGDHPYCHPPMCSKQCPENEICELVDGIEKCVCYDGRDKCNKDVCRGFSCPYKEKCIEKDGKPVCICKNGGTVPDCLGHCPSCNYRGKCVFYNNSPKCICSYEEHDVKQTDYPNCNPCNNHNCAPNGKCEVLPNGRPKCVCNNQAKFWPECGQNPLPCNGIDCAPLENARHILMEVQNAFVLMVVVNTQTVMLNVPIVWE